MNKLSTNLKNLLLHSKLSENELARKTGVAQQIINRILTGENKNPKIATLSPLANYFMVSISQLIGDEISGERTRLNTNHLGWHEIPMLNWDLLIEGPIDKVLSQSNEKLLVDIKPSKGIYALRMHGNSMEPKFSDGTILVFDPNQQPVSGDFTLLKLSNNEIEMRQIFIKNETRYKKCLNPGHKDYNLTKLSKCINYLGVLIQSKTDHTTR